MTGKRSKQTGQRIARLREAEWDFSSVPRTEVPFCLLWEMARDSGAIQSVGERLRHYYRRYDDWWKANPDAELYDGPFSGHSRAIARAKKLVPLMNYPFAPVAVEQLLDLFWAGWQVTPPWRRVKRAYRNSFSQLASNAPAVRTGGLAELKELSDHFERREPNASQGRARPREWNVEAKCIVRNKSELVLLVINWQRFDATAIYQSLLKWWKKHPKPTHLSSPVKSGRGIRPATQLRAMLDNLGYARLRAHYTPKQIFENARAAWTTLMGPCEFDPKSAREFEGKLSERAERFWAWFPKVFPFDTEPPKSKRDFERRKTRTGPPKRNAPGGD